ncbi:ATP-binding protein [Streptomyces sp. NPDC059928]|uniref:ATP-binding protein n=1 Tax=unclassified Streptomyces TaxID=2593676 RepID=UPI00364A56AC
MSTRQAPLLVVNNRYGIALARDHVLTQVVAWGVVEPDQQEAIRLVASELITNALVHAGGRVSVGLRLDDNRLRLTVHDNSSDQQPHRHNVDGSSENGRGLLLAEHFATRIGWGRAEQGKEVWAEFDIPMLAPPARSQVPRPRGRIDGLCRRLLILPQGLALAAQRTATVHHHQHGFSILPPRAPPGL